MIKELLEKAVESGSTDALCALLSQYEEDSRLVRLAEFSKAMSTFQSKVGEIKKTGVVDFTYGGKRTYFKYALLSDIDEAIRKPLTESGLSKRWEFIVDQNMGRGVICIVTHESGHSESTTIYSTHVDSADGKGQLKGESSTETYLMRRTLIGALGLSSVNDDDGGEPEKNPENKYVSDSQVKQLRAAIKKSSIDEPSFLKKAGVETIEQILKARFKGAINFIETNDKSTKEVNK